MYCMQWSLAMDTLEIEGQTWGFVPPDSHYVAQFPIMLRMGDYNMDGYPDAIAPIRYTNTQ